MLMLRSLHAVQTLAARQIDAGIDAANAIGKYNLAKAKYDYRCDRICSKQCRRGCGGNARSKRR